MASPRRMGPRDSEASHAMLDAAERVLREEGHAALSSRRVAEVAGLKQQLVYYYFHSMDDLVLATFRRRSERALAHLAGLSASDHPAADIWSDAMGRADSRLSSEFMALANRNDGLRAEVAAFLTRARQMQAEAIVRAWPEQGPEQKQGGAPLTPGALAFLMSAVSLLKGQETALGVDEAHGDVRALADWMLGRLK